MDADLVKSLRSYDDTAPLERAATIPGPWYTDERIAELERKTVFGRTWQMIGRAAQVAEPGQYLTGEIAGEPIVVTRSNDGVLRAFFNVCRHHAAAVMTEPEGKASVLRCPYHGWTYGLDGVLKGVPEFEGVQCFEREKMGLAPVRVEAWEKFVFVCLDANAPSLSEYLGGMVQRFQPMHLEKLHFAGRRLFELKCNWKVFVDNYLDGGYHVPHLHKGLNSILEYKNYTIENEGRFCLQSSPIDASGGEQMTAQVRQGRALYFWLYPNVMFNWYEGYLDTNLVIPLGIDRMAVIFEFYFADVSAASAARNQQSMDVSERIQDEDHAICESVQRGLSSRAYGAGRLSVRREAGEHLFHRLLAGDLKSAIGKSVAAD
ncbi:MAG: aromatic ring-hydroxylating dioxygenase subunit alpha [Candidatus Koribacter versatilis]|uniref:Aromatic ring-hydroxylating dioxygenase subunit alpha n=1 Tax=Candidatus Korobacter versatilis TaxID=658062 RepID=A0A932A9Q2_9BACT|nr:aromatic ring-hydroxylating dioxygenase subunit alpha [Candidatus Koribacter versatilis]